MAELLSAEQALETLHEHGQDANSDYNDSDEVQGWFGWTVRGDALIVTHQVDDDGFEDPANKVTHWWRLVPIADEAVPGDLAAEGEEWVRGYVAAWKPSGLRDALRAEALLAEYDRRGQVEQRAREIAEANTSAPTKNPVAIRAARYILGELS